MGFCENNCPAIGKDYMERVKTFLNETTAGLTKKSEFKKKGGQKKKALKSEYDQLRYF